MTDRAYDIVLFGATGFTGGLTAEYLAANAPDGLRWALAGRNQAKLEAVRERLVAIDPGCAELPLLQADCDRRRLAVAKLAESTGVLVTTVGPYALYGEPLVAACAAAGTDYVDLTGEPEFVDRMWLKYDADRRADRRAAGALLRLRLDPARPRRLFHRAAVARGRAGHDRGLRAGRRRILGRDVRARRSPASHAPGRRSAPAASAEARAASRRQEDPRPNRPPRHAGEQGGWVVPLPTIDPFIVRRSAAALDRYGPDFTYGHYLVTKHLTTLASLGVEVPTAFLAAQLAPTRNLLLKVAPDPGEGPSEQKRAKSGFACASSGTPTAARATTEVSGGDPGYNETSKMLSESALALALDDIPDRAGQLTPVAAFGDSLLERLPKAGMTIRVVDD